MGYNENNNDNLLQMEFNKTLEILKSSRGCCGIYLVATRDNTTGRNVYELTAVYNDNVSLNRDTEPIASLNARYSDPSMIDYLGNIIVKAFNVSHITQGYEAISHVQELLNCTILYDEKGIISNKINGIEQLLDGFGCSCYEYSSLINPNIQPVGSSGPGR